MELPAITIVLPVQAQVKQPDASDTKSADVQNGGAADGTRLPQPTVLSALPPGQGVRVDQLVFCH
jgi:hypothetical protein